MGNDPYEWQLARYRAARDRLYLGNRLTRAQVLRSQEQIRLSLELLETPLPPLRDPPPANEIPEPNDF